MTAEQLAVLAGILLSLGFSYIPRLSTWFEALDGTYKRLLMLGLLLAAAAGSFGLACAGWFAPEGVTCDQAGLEAMVWAFINAAIANQATYLVSPKMQPQAPPRLQ